MALEAEYRGLHAGPDSLPFREHVLAYTPCCIPGDAGGRRLHVSPRHPAAPTSSKSTAPEGAADTANTAGQDAALASSVHRSPTCFHTRRVHRSHRTVGSITTTHAASLEPPQPERQPFAAHGCGAEPVRSSAAATTRRHAGRAYRQRQRRSTATTAAARVRPWKSCRAARARPAST